MSSKKKASKTVSYIYQKPSLVPKNDLQKKYMNAIDNFKIVVGTGVAGSGKTYIAAVKAADMLVDPRSPIERIIIARPNEIEGTKSIGFLKGDKNEKMEPLVAPVSSVIKTRLGASAYDNMLKNEKIELLPLEHIKGRSFNNCFVIIDEAEDIEWSILKTLLLRTGEDCKIIIDGDIRQTSISRESGLLTLFKVMDEYHTPCTHIDFGDWKYCVRSDECRLFGEIFESMGV